MSNEWAPAPPPRPPRRWPRRLAWVCAGLLVFLVVIYLVATSAMFLQSFILPRVSKAINANVTVADASISPFFSVTLRDLKVETSVLERPLLTAGEVRARYSLIDILGGDINVREVTLVSPVVNLVGYENGTSNLDPLLKSSGGETQPPPPSPPSKPLQVQIKSLTITNAAVRRIQHRKGGGQDLAEVSNVNLSLANVGNARTASLNLGADLLLDQGNTADGTTTSNQVLQAKLGGGFEFTLTADLKPQSLRGKTTLEVRKVSDAFRELNGLSATLDCDLTPAELKTFSLSFVRAGKPLGQISASGPLDLAKQEGHVKLEISPIDRQVLNLAGAALGIDFGPTTISATHDIELGNGGQLINASGSFNARQLSLSQKGATTKPLDFLLSYNVTVNRAENTAELRSFNLAGTQQGEPFLRGSLTRPMKLSLAGATNAVEDSAFDLTVTNLNLADWRAFIGDVAGNVSLSLSVLAQEAGKKLKLDLAANLADLAANVASNRIREADVALLLSGRMDDFAKIQLDTFNLQLAHQKQPAVLVKVVGSINASSQDADLRTKLEVFVPRLAALLAVPGFKAGSGSVKLDAHLAQRNATPSQTNNPAFDQAASALLRLEEFSGEYAGFRFDRFGTSVDFDAGVTNGMAEIKKFTGAFRQSGLGGGRIDVSGSYHLTNHSGGLELKVTDLNENTLRSFVAGALGHKSLASISINLNTSATYDAKGDSGLKGELQVVNLLIGDPTGRLPKQPLTAELKLDTAMRDEVATIRQFSGTVRQGTRQGGSLEVSGNCDLKKQAGQFALKLSDLNQTALGPLLAPALGDKTLTAISINAGASASFDAKGESAVSGELHVSNLLVSDPKSPAPPVPLALDAKLEGNLRDDQAALRELSASTRFGGQPGGALAVNGRYHLKTHAGELALKLTDLNQHALHALLGNAPGGKPLSSISINADASATSEPSGAATVKGQFDVSNLVILDGEGKPPKSPWTANLSIDAGFANQALDLQKLRLNLSPTDRARNQLALTGRVDFARSNAITGALQLTGESLDLTPYYDLFAGSPSTNAAPPAASAKKPETKSTAATASSNTEPAAIVLPFQQFTFGINIARLYLRELSINNLTPTIKLDGGRVQLKPFQLLLNDAPTTVGADLNLGVPGYEYDVTFAADKAPLEPIANTFAPDQRGQYKGNLIAAVQVKGAGVTGRSLQKSLAGQLGFSFTNANIQISNPRLRAFLTPIALLLGTPDLVNSPLSWVGATAQLGGGKINLSQFNLVSDAFNADTQGDIKIADELMNSPIDKWPMHFYLRRNLAQRIKLVPKNTPPEAAYVKLPDFIKVAGTLGEPKAELNKLALGGAALDKLTEKLPGTKDLNPLDLFNKPK